jgi:uncharacterized protein YjaG (DUF416 family)
MNAVELRQHQAELRTRLRALSHRQLVAFGLLCAERLIPNYQPFVDEHGWGSAESLRKGLDLAWDWLETGTSKDVAGIRTECEAQAPDTEDFDSMHVSSALDAANAAASVLDLVEEPDSGVAGEIASLATDSIDMYVRHREAMEPNTPRLEDEIANHPLMRLEVQRQRRDLDVVSGAWTARGLRAEFRAVGVGHLQERDV